MWIHRYTFLGNHYLNLYVTIVDTSTFTFSCLLLLMHVLRSRLLRYASREFTAKKTVIKERTLDDTRQVFFRFLYCLSIMNVFVYHFTTRD